MKIGIIQGRLTPPVDSFIQEFPNDWKIEFIRLKKIGLTHIDWIVTTKSFNNNPIFTEDLSLLPINSICADNLVSEKIFDREFLYKNLTPICDSALRNKIYSITIPLLEGSNIKDPGNRIKLRDMIIPFSEKYKDIVFSFEFESDPDEILEFVGNISNFKITYDTGNIVSHLKSGKYGIHNYFLSKLINKIDNIHLKDRTIDCKTVRPGTGDTNFKEVFDFLKSKYYNGRFTIQTAREESDDEYNTIDKHNSIFNKLYYNNIV